MSGTNTGVSLTGTVGRNVLTGTQRDDSLVGLGGNDLLRAGAGADLVFGGSGADQIEGATGNDTIYGDSSNGNPSDTGPAGNDVILAGGGNDLVFGEGGDDFIDGSHGHDTLNGGDGDDLILGGLGVDRLNGDAGDDALEGGAGNDVLDGGNGVDEAVFLSGADTVTVLTITETATGWSVTASGTVVDPDGGPTPVTVNEGTDTLSNVEVVVNGVTGARTLLVGNGGFATIQAAVDAANAGDTILISSDSYVGDVNVTKALTFVGQGSGVGGTVVAGMFNVEGTLAGALTFRNIAIDATGEAYGIRVSAVSSGGSLALEGVAISNASINGLFYGHPSNSNFTNAALAIDILDSISIVDSIFTNNGDGNSGGRGGVSLFGFDGDLTVTGNTFTGGGFGKAIQVVGLGRPATPFDGSAFTYSSLGDVVFSGNTLAGSFGGVPGIPTGNRGQDAIAFYYHDGFASFAATDNVADAEAAWGLLNFDWVDGDLDLSAFFTSAVNRIPGGFVTTPQGSNNPNSITGSAFNDLIDARGGADTVNGGAGDDVIRVTTDVDHTTMDVVNGGNGADTLIFTSTTANATLTLGSGVTSVETVALSPANGTAGTNINAALATGVEAINGNDGANILTGGAGAQTITGGAGNDTMSGGAGNDTLLGGTGVDTAAYGVTLTGANVTATATGWTVNAGAEGTDTLDRVHVITHSGMPAGPRILLVGNGGFATIQAAVDAANAGDTILVASGDFNGADVDKDLTILGALYDEVGFTALEVGGGPRSGSDESVITGSGFRIAEGLSVQISGFRFEGVNAINTNLGLLVQDVIFTNNVVVGGSNQFFGNGNGLGTVTITGNYINSVSGNGLQINGAGTGDVTVSGNLFDGTGTGGAGVNANGIADFTFSDNVVTNTNSHGIQVAGAMGDVVIDGNVFDATVLSGSLDRGAISVAGPQAFGSLEVTGNTVTNSPFGLVFRGAPDADTVGLAPTISGNDFSGAVVAEIGYAGTAVANLLEGGAEDALFQGFDGNDTLNGGAGNDTLDGGNGEDVVVYGETLAAGAVTANAGGWLVVSATEGTDTLKDVHIIEHGADRILLVGNGGFATIQAALTAAVDGDVIHVGPGTFAESLTINKRVTIIGSGNGTDPATDTIIDPAGSSLDGFWFGAGSAGSGLQSLRVTGANNAIQLENDVGLDDLVFDGIAASGNALYGINFRNGTIGDVTIRNSEFSDNGSVGVRIPTTGNYGTITVDDSSFANNGSHGLVTLGATVAQITVTDTAFINNGTGGATGQGDLILNTFSGNATLERLTFNGDGSGSNALQVTGRTNPGSGAEPDVRKAVAPIANVVIEDVTIEGSYARDVVIIGRYTDLDGLSIADLDLSATTGPSWAQINLFNVGGDVNLADYGLANAGLRVNIATNNGVDFATAPDATAGAALTGGTGADLLVGHVLGDDLVGGAGNDTLLGGVGNDTLTGGAGDDSIDGGAGIDRVVFGVTVTAADITSSGGAWSISTALGEGADSITGVEIVEGAGGASFLLVGNGGFATIQAAIDAATAGDTILLADGPYADAVNINKAVTILGPNSGIAGTGMRGAEAVITGPVTVTAASGNVTISGVEFRYTGAVNTLGVMANVTSGANVTIEDSRFFTETAQGGAGSGRAIQLTTGATGQITIDDNFFGGVITDPAIRFGGDQTLTPPLSPANFNRAIWSDGSSSRLTITDNTFVNMRTAMNLDGYDSAPVSTVTGNTIVNSGSGISIGTPSATAITGISGNVFQNVQTDFNLQNVTTALTFATGTNTGTTLVPTEPGLLVLGGSQGDSLTGNAGVDVLSGRDGNDTLDGGDGDDFLIGGNGDDRLVAGVGAQTFAGGAGVDTVDYSRDTAGVQVFLDLASSNGGEAANDTLTGIENLIGGSGDDVLYGDTGANVLAGGLGNDSLDGGGGNDTVAGGAGADAMVGGAGFDILDYGSSALGVAINLATGSAAGGDAAGDVFFEFEGVFGSAFNDTLTGSSAADVLVGGAGDDVILGGLGSDTLEGGTGIDTLSYDGSPIGVNVNLATGAVSGGHATGDVISGFENLIGSAGNDTLTGDAGDNRLAGGAGNDVLNGGGGIDLADYSTATGNLTITMGATVTVAGFGTDTWTSIEGVIGGSGNDLITGGAGDDVLFGGAGNDTIRGGNGNDTVDAGAGGNIVNLGAGADTLVVSAFYGSIATNWTQINEWTAGEDKIDLSQIDLSGPGSSFQFVSTAGGAFIGGGQASVRWDVAGGNVRIWLDAGDGGAAEGLITLFARTSVTVSDFML